MSSSSLRAPCWQPKFVRLSEMSKRAREEVQDGCRAFPRILAVRAYVTKPPEGEGQQGADCHDVAPTHWINGHPTYATHPG